MWHYTITASLHQGKCISGEKMWPGMKIAVAAGHVTRSPWCGTGGRSFRLLIPYWVSEGISGHVRGGLCHPNRQCNLDPVTTHLPISGTCCLISCLNNSFLNNIFSILPLSLNEFSCSGICRLVTLPQLPESVWCFRLGYAALWAPWRWELWGGGGWRWLDVWPAYLRSRQGR